MEDFQSLGIGGILVLLVIRELFAFLKPLLDGRKKSNGSTTSTFRAAEDMATNKLIQAALTESNQKHDKQIELLTEIKAVLAERR